MKKTVGGFLVLSALAGLACGNRKNPIAVEMDLYLRAEAASLDDLILQTAVRKRLGGEDGLAGRGLHVRVSQAVVILSGSVANDAERQDTERIARETRVEINGQSVPVREVKSYLALR